MNLQNQQRLAGIIVLTILIVLISPLLFTTNKPVAKQSELPDATSTNLAPVPAKAPSVNIPEKSLSPSQEERSEKTAIIPEASSKSTTNITTIAAEQPKIEAISASSKETILPSSSDVSWAVQVGCFSNQTYLNRLLDQLQSNGYLVTLRKLNTTSKTLTRVLVGKESSQAAAKKLAEQLEKRFKLRGNIVKYSA